MSRILHVKNLSFDFPVRANKKEWINILNDINFSIEKGQIVGLVGKSGCGKTTLGKILVNYFHLNRERHRLRGEIYYNNGKNTYQLNSREYMHAFKIQPIQMIFQNPKKSLDLRMRAKDQLVEAICVKNNYSKKEIQDKLADLSSKYKIETKLDSFPMNMSGGERRRLGIAKIIATEPKIIIADEPVASLDVSIKYEIMDTILDLRDKGYTIIIISHDINLVKNNADMIFAMDSGTLVEKWNPTTKPVEPATNKLLMDSDEVNSSLKGIIPD